MKEARCRRCAVAFRPKSRSNVFCGVECQRCWHNERESESHRSAILEPNSAEDAKMVQRCLSAMRDGCALDVLRQRFPARIVNEARAQLGPQPKPKAWLPVGAP